MEQTKRPARFVLTWILLLIVVTLNSSCTPSGDSVTAGEISQTGELGGVEPLDPGVSVPNGYYAEQIKTIAGNSTCASYSWSGRGKAPAAYIKGMALTYARSFCRLKTSEAAPTNLVNILGRGAGSSTTDALALYASTFSSLSMDVKNAGVGPLRSLYTLGIGLGMRESSGKYCEGRDMSASNTSANTAEAGMFQTSYDSIGASAELTNLYNEYKVNPNNCFLDTFKVGVSCGSSSIAGSGAGADYQAFNKSCPAFAAEYAMVMLRVRRNHYGPINRKEAEVTTSCNQMLKSVETFIENDLNSCADIML
jgi:hypothetical protein